MFNNLILILSIIFTVQVILLALLHQAWQLSKSDNIIIAKNVVLIIPFVYLFMVLCMGVI